MLCSGEGLRQGVVGREIRSWIDTRRAGPGELTAHCTGPRKVAYCELYDHGDATFTLNVKPQEPGRHALTIKYAGQHVMGSPFTLRVAGAPDPTKVSLAFWMRRHFVYKAKTLLSRFFGVPIKIFLNFRFEFMVPALSMVYWQRFNPDLYATLEVPVLDN